MILGHGDSCDTATFALSAAAPDGWTAVSGNASLSLAPGTSGTTSLDVTSPDTAAPDFHDIAATAVNSADAAYAGSATATYGVNDPVVNQPPVAIDDSATTDQGMAVNVPVLANESDPDGDPLIVVSVGQGAKGTVTINADGTITYRPHRKSKGSDSFGYTIEDDAGNATSAVVSVLVKKAYAGGGNGKGRNK